jgi:hypothetical protein
MARISEPGITHYPMLCDHIHNKKVRLLISEFDAAGYWVWCCLMAEGYRTNGYFYDTNDKDGLELFALDVCKKQVSLVKEVIQGCIRRGLFDKTVFDMFGILSSPHMQETYVKATRERRRKETTICFIQEYLLIEISAEEQNISIFPLKKQIVPRIKPIVPRNNSQSKVEYSKEDSTVSTKEQGVSADAEAPPLPKTYKQLSEEEFYAEIATFKNDFSKELLREFFDYWSEKDTKGKMRFQLERTWELKKRLQKWARPKKFTNATHQQSVNGSTEKLGTSEGRMQAAANW